MSSDPVSDHAAPSDLIQRVLVLATVLLLEAAALGEPGAAERLVADRVLPAVYRDRYDGQFLRAFANAVQVTCRQLTREAPHLSDTLSQLAAQAIFRYARGVMLTRGGCLDLAARIDPNLPRRLRRDPARFSAELERCYEAAFENSNVMALFELSDPADLRELQLTPGERELRRFENWRVRFRQPGG